MKSLDCETEFQSHGDKIVSFDRYVIWEANLLNEGGLPVSLIPEDGKWHWVRVELWVDTDGPNNSLFIDVDGKEVDFKTIKNRFLSKKMAVQMTIVEVINAHFS